MSSDQQREALAHFSLCAVEWREFAEGRTNRFNVSAARHRAVVSGCSDLQKPGRFLDIGCGTGQLVIEMAKRGHESRGIDFSREMVDLSLAASHDASVVADFSCESIFDMSWPHAYDIVSAQGLIEYFSLSETKHFLALVGERLPAGGRFFLGTRNRLFNVFSLNAYTEMELALGTERRLLEEATLLAGEPSWDVVREKLLAFPPLDATPPTHPHTGRIEVATRHQYTPAELAVMLRGVGCELVRLFPIHYHAFPAGFTTELNPQHIGTAMWVDGLSLPNHRFVPQSSTCVLQFAKV